MNDKRPVSHILTGLAGGSFAFLAASTPVFGTTAGTSAAVTFLVMGGLGAIAFVALLRPTRESCEETQEMPDDLALRRGRSRSRLSPRASRRDRVAKPAVISAHVGRRFSS
ncbi:hypothetical protein [Rhodobacteraceae bacterium DSL-40]|uniref:hypothetical protein n=1 Tax=Amaricoccus sp. B4 TaxID=3368557 RepID=UPI000DAEBA9A